MRVALASDLHVEFWPFDNYLKNLKEKDFDVLLLLGDISEDTETLEKLASDQFKNSEIIFVLGNHEFYHPRNIGFIAIEQKYKDLEKEYDNLTVFGSSANWKDFEGYRFFGGTNWSYIPPKDEHMIKNGINDFRMGNVTIQNVNDAKIQFDKDLEVLIQTDKTLIGLSHFIPEYFCSHPRFIGSEYNVYFVSPIKYNIFSRCKYWFFGHGHDSINITREGCNFVSNPLGYPFERKEPWEPLIIDLGDQDE